MKTIEEAAREAVRKEYLCESCAYKDDCDLCGGENTAFDCCECPADSYEDGFKAGANHIMSLPLSERITAEEREKILKEYQIDDEGVTQCSWLELLELAVKNKQKRDMLERIFGKSMFEEEGGRERKY